MRLISIAACAVGLGISIAGAQRISRQEPARYAGVVARCVARAGSRTAIGTLSFGEWTRPAVNRGIRVATVTFQ
jgi:hypothetical protein